MVIIKYSYFVINAKFIDNNVTKQLFLTFYVGLIHFNKRSFALELLKIDILVVMSSYLMRKQNNVNVRLNFSFGTIITYILLSVRIEVSGIKNILPIKIIGKR